MKAAMLRMVFVAAAAIAGCTSESSAPAKRGEGATCTADSDCESGECAQIENTRACTAPAGAGCSGWSWPGRGDARDGDHRCYGNTIEVCRDGEWQTQSHCTCTVQYGDPRKPPYPSRCADTSQPGTAACVYAGKACFVCYGVSSESNAPYARTCKSF